MLFRSTGRMPEAENIDGCLYEAVSSVMEEYVSPRLFRVLVAEDIEENATLVTLRLGQQGHEVLWVKNGLEAVEAFRTGQHDLILMDVMMPELDGLNATRRIRELEQGTQTPIPILALTASVMREDHDKCLAAGMNSVEAKPIDFDALFTAMEQSVSEGVGRPNTSRRIGIDHSAEVDLSPLQGVADVSKALSTWRDPRAYAKALISFAAERANDATEMARLLNTHPDDVQPARAVAHALKGVAGNLAIEQVAQSAINVDTALKSEQRPQAFEKIEALALSLAVAVSAIGELNLPDAISVPLKPFDPAVVGRLVQELLLVLNELNPDSAEPVLTQLGEYISDVDLAPIRREIDVFDFDSAKNKMHSLAEKLGLSLIDKA